MISVKKTPSFEKLSILISAILLSYALAQFISVPGRLIALQIIGVFIPIEIDINTVALVAVAGITATGTDWLIRDHPNLEGRSTLPHWLLPTLTAWIIHIALTALTISPIWWLAFVFGGIFILVVLLAEYIVVFPEDQRYPLASIGLNTLAFIQFLILAVSLRTMGIRLLMTIPALALATGVMSLRISQLKIQDRWLLSPSILNLIVITQVGATFHYLPFSPIDYGLALLAFLYILINFYLNLELGLTIRRAAIEPLIIASIILGCSFLI